jgi:hypothetical protein
VKLLADTYTYSRIALGITGLLAPGPVGQGFGLGTSPGARLAARHIAARDLVAGVGILQARKQGRPTGWYQAAAVTDAIDAAIAVVAGATGKLEPRRAFLVMVLAGGSAATGFLLAGQASSEVPS